MPKFAIREPPIHYRVGGLRWGKTYRAGARAMSNEIEAAGRAGMHWHGPDLLSCRARAQHYRRYAAEIRAIAESKPAGLIRDQLLALACQYELLAAMVGGERRVTGCHAGGGPKLAIPETAAEAVSS